MNGNSGSGSPIRRRNRVSKSSTSVLFTLETTHEMGNRTRMDRCLDKDVERVFRLGTSDMSQRDQLTEVFPL